MDAACDILFFGDLHGHFDHCLPVVQDYRPKAIILLGDMQAPEPLDKRLDQVSGLTDVWWIPGNHDTDNEVFYDNLYGSALAERNLHGRVVEIAGLQIAGLGGVFRGKIWQPQCTSWNYFSQEDFHMSLPEKKCWRGGIDLRHHSSIFPETYMQLRRHQADILVTHEAPSCNRYGFAAIDRLARAMGVQKLFHGHHHDCYDYSPHFQRLGFKVFSVGLRGVTDLNGVPLLEGEQDGLNGDRVVRNMPSI